MKFPLVFALLVLVTGNVFGRYVRFRNDLTYDDLLQTNVTCAFHETCQEGKSSPYLDRSCGCDMECSEFGGTCCIDSPNREDSVPMLECINTQSSFSATGNLLVSRCPPEVDSESIWKDLCEKKWDGEDDMMMLAPVSSLETFISYKNYYCFRCHEEGSDKFLSWDLHIKGNSTEQGKVYEDFSVTYDKERWIARTGDGYVVDNIHLEFIPPPLEVHPEQCKFVSVSDCDDAWTYEDTREKCRGYTAVVYSKNNESVSFKNPHCAICNFEHVENLSCELLEFGAASFDAKKKFSFAHLLNIHRDDSDETKRCEENQLWDPYGKRCRRIACAIPGYVIKEGRCTSP